MKKLFLMLSVIGVLMTGCGDHGLDDDLKPNGGNTEVGGGDGSESGNTQGNGNNSGNNAGTNPSQLPEPAANEIYYTTTDGLFINISNRVFFQIAVASHTVKNDSVFVLTFTRDLGEIQSLININFQGLETLKSIALSAI